MRFQMFSNGSHERNDCEIAALMCVRWRSEDKQKVWRLNQPASQKLRFDRDERKGLIITLCIMREQSLMENATFLRISLTEIS